ncbi:hypothetical protein SFOMI_4760 [Sphingobium fuliginis]|uniref:Uncharacterized protein n=1 Tax=Sphingobium fuliginis (strain ATCC 27551) TaxID=336203 RepID=A0A292ZMU3_SPHSA|nr:DUF6880 family protein [Sphingobium fuliginis]GAY24180.1 hypothetical protein SFOMI_4760 [Sphingobium fuliginis]
MASSKTLNQANLETLGANRLAQLLLELVAVDAQTKRRLRLELASANGSGDVAGEVAKRLATIAKAEAFVDWNKVKPLARDIEAQRRAIMEHIAPTDPATAFELLWKLIALAVRCSAGATTAMVRWAPCLQRRSLFLARWPLRPACPLTSLSTRCSTASATMTMSSSTASSP